MLRKQQKKKKFSIFCVATGREIIFKYRIFLRNNIFYIAGDLKMKGNLGISKVWHSYFWG